MGEKVPDFPVRPEKVLALREKMEKYGIKEEDLQETFVRARGPGGQKVNKASTCVLLVHKPTGISVRCEKTRSQALNRFLARRLLVERFEEVVLGIRSERSLKAERIRKNKRRRRRFKEGKAQGREDMGVKAEAQNNRKVGQGEGIEDLKRQERGLMGRPNPSASPDVGDKVRGDVDF